MEWRRFSQHGSLQDVCHDKKHRAGYVYDIGLITVYQSIDFKNVDSHILSFLN